MNTKSSSQFITVLISSVGRRAQLIGCFREALNDLNVRGRVIGIDAAPNLAPAAHLLDKCYQVPHCDDPAFPSVVLRIAKEEKVLLIVPTIDPELPIYAAWRKRFLDDDVTVMISDPETVNISNHKNETHRWLIENHFPTVDQDTPQEVLANPERWKLPLILKPRCGSGSIGVRKIESLGALRGLGDSQPDSIVQECAAGDEYTVNVFVMNGRCVCAVPHRRLETRGGEVSKGITTRNVKLIELTSALAERLPGARGALNIQCFVDHDTAIKVIEINARFGGGFPLAYRAGAKFPLWSLESLLARDSSANNEWEDQLLMLRYDSATFVSTGTSTSCPYSEVESRAYSDALPKIDETLCPS